LKAELRLTVCARPSRGPESEINFTNFSLEPTDNDRLSEWMSEHLSVAVFPGIVTEGAERALIGEHFSPLNLTGWDNPYRGTIRDARARCAAEARNRSRR
jgi:hypothetical protein